MKKVYSAPQYHMDAFVNISDAICTDGVSMPGSWDDLITDEE